MHNIPLPSGDDMSDEKDQNKHLLAVRPSEDTEQVIPRLQERQWNVDIAQSIEGLMASLAGGKYDALLIDNSTTPDADGFITAMRQLFPELKFIVTGDNESWRDDPDEYRITPEEPGSLPDIKDAVQPKQGRWGETDTPKEAPETAVSVSWTTESIIRATSRWKRAVPRPQELYFAIMEHFHRCSGAPWVSFFLKDANEGEGLRLIGCRGFSPGRTKNERVEDVDAIRQLVSVDDSPPSIGPVPWALEAVQHCQLDSERCLSVPLWTEQEVVGVIYLAVPVGRTRYHESQVHMFSALAREAADLVKLSRQVNELRVDSLTDGLTGLYNRQYFKTELETEIERARRSGRGLVLAMLDIDHFKDYNDLYGHQAGDRALQRIAQIIQEEVRSTDTPCRYGGEEFVIILPDTNSEIRLDRENGLKIVDRVRQAVEQDTFLPSQNLTLSGGLSVFREDASDADSMILHADQMLYRAKRAGRNRVVAGGA